MSTIPEKFENSSTTRAMSRSECDGSSTVVNCVCGWMDFAFPSVNTIPKGFSNPSATVETVDGSCRAAEEKPVVAVAAVAAEVGHHQGYKRFRSADQYSLKGMVSNSGWMCPVMVAMCLPAGAKAEPGGDDGGGWDDFMHA